MHEQGPRLPTISSICPRRMALCHVLPSRVREESTSAVLLGTYLRAGEEHGP